MLRKVVQIVQISAGLCPRVRSRSLQRSPDLFAGFEGPYFLEKGRERKEKIGDERKGRKKEREGRGRIFQPPLAEV